MKMAIDEESVSKCLEKLLISIVRFCLRHGLRIQSFLELAKKVYVRESMRDLEYRGLQVSDSRISVMTGLQRRDVARFTREVRISPSKVDLMAKVLGRWAQHPSFLGKNYVPRPLSWRTKTSEFAELVRDISQDLNPYTILFELERSGAVKKDGENLLLINKNLINREDLDSGFSVLSDDLDSLICGVEENVLCDTPVPNLHLRTFYDQVTASKETQIRKWLLEKGTEFHAEASKFLSQFDCDLNPNLQGEKERICVALGAFSQVRNVDNDIEK